MPDLNVLLFRTIITELEDLGLITFESGEPGMAKTPVIEYDDIDIRLPLGSNE